MVHLLKGLRGCSNPSNSLGLCWTEAPRTLKAPDTGEEAGEATSDPRAVGSLCPSQELCQEGGRKPGLQRREQRLTEGMGLPKLIEPVPGRPSSHTCWSRGMVPLCEDASAQ